MNEDPKETYEYIERSTRESTDEKKVRKRKILMKICTNSTVFKVTTNLLC